MPSDSDRFRRGLEEYLSTTWAWVGPITVRLLLDAAFASAGEVA